MKQQQLASGRALSVSMAEFNARAKRVSDKLADPQKAPPRQVNAKRFSKPPVRPES